MTAELIPCQVFRGERLQLAREFKGMTQQQLAADVAASSALISLCESGKKRSPAPDLIKACADVLDVESDFFYVKLEDVCREEECSFRHRRSTPERLKTKIRARATLIALIVERLRAQFRFPPLNLPRLEVGTAPDAIEAAAEHCREHWKLGPDSPIKQVGRVMELAGVIIVPNLVESAKVDAFSRYGTTCLVFLNKAVTSTSRWHFDIAHECGHLVMHAGIPTGTIETEQAADRFASAFLLPKRAFCREFGRGPLSWRRIFELKRRWFVSAAAIVRRAYDLNMISAVEYRRAFQYMSAKGWNKGEPYEPPFQQPELLDMALKGLGTKVGLTVHQLCAELKLKPKTFEAITGMEVPSAANQRTHVIEFDPQFEPRR